MKTNYLKLLINNHKLYKIIVLTTIISCFSSSLVAQQGKKVRVSNDPQFINAAQNPVIAFIDFDAGYYESVKLNLGEGIKGVKMENGNGGRTLACIYAIQESSSCFDPEPPETTVCDTAKAMTFDVLGCGCCPPNDVGTWSYVSGPGNVTFSSPNEDTTEFCVDAPGSYLLRYTWPNPWNSHVETEYYFYVPYVAEIQANDSCGLSTNVHFEYSSEFGNPGTSLEWTLNGAPYSGPGFNPAGDTVDFLLTVPSCGEWILVASLNSAGCNLATVSATVNLQGNAGPIITGVGADTTVVCPDTAVFSQPTASDPCGPDPVLTYETDTIPGDCPDSYTLIRTWTAINDCGNISLDTQVIVHLPNPNPPLILGYQTEELGDTIFAECDEEVNIPFPEILTPCGPAEVFYERSDGGDWEDPFEPGTTTQVCFWGISPCGYSTDTICFPVIVEECEIIDGQLCTLTQGFYGNSGGSFCNGMGTAELIDYLLSSGNLVVGSNGNTMKFMPGQSGCVIDLLPGGGPAKKITGANTCASHPGIQMKNGRINNILLAQTITLGLNLRLDTGLANLEIFSDTLLTAPSSGCGGDDDTITGPYTKRAIPLSVYNVLSMNGTIVPTVWDLYQLANKGLGGQSVGATTLSAISDAVDKINVGFDECAFGHFQLLPPTQSMEVLGGTTANPGVSSLQMKISPNPFSTSAKIEFTAPENGHVFVEIYSLTGVKLAVLYDGMAEAGMTYQCSFRGAPGMELVTYICVIRTERESRFERMIMLK